MSSLFKLSIQGIRSFDSERQETIQFGFPLTLICGQNGCGKTTIIECLKYATTGDLPPNSKGGAFINDPNIANRNIVNGQVKLAFKSTNDKSMIVNRSMQLSKKRGRAGTSSNTFKTLEGQLSVMNKGVKSAISSKNAELDTSVPMYLGASKAILDYVIFCHQDDALWPLSEASVLKKRFDEIFEASKFTKVLDNLKSIRKDMAIDIKLVEQSVQHLKLDKTRAKRIRDKLDENNKRVDEFTHEIASITMSIENYEKDAANLFESNQQFQETLAEHERLKMDQRNLSQNLDRLRRSMSELTDSDAQLAHQLANFAELDRNKKSQVNNLEKELQDLTSEQNQLQSEFNQYTRIEGSLTNKKQTYDSNVLRIEKYFTQSSDLYDLAVSDRSSKSANLDLKNMLEDRLANFTTTFRQKSEQFRIQISQAESKLRRIQDSITREEQHNAYCTEDINNATIKIRDLKQKLTSLQYDESTLEIEKTELENLMTKFNAKKDASNPEDIDKKIESGNTKLSKLEHEVDELTKKISMSNRQSDLHARVAVQKEAKASKEEVLKKSVERNSSEFKGLTQSDLNPTNCLNVLTESIKDTSVQVNEAQNATNDKLHEINSTKTSIQLHEATLSKYKDSVTIHKQRILQVLEENEIAEYEKIVAELEDDHNTTLHNLNTFDVTKNFKIKAIELAKVEKSCTLCKRPLEGSFLDSFIQQLQESVRTMSVEKLQENVNGTREELDNAKKINPDILEYRKLSSEIPALSSRIEEESTSLNELQKAYESLMQTLETHRTKLDNLKALENPIRSISRVRDDIEECDRQVSIVESELNDYGASAISLDELQKLQQSKNFEIKALRSTINDDVEFKYIQQKELTRLDSNIKDKRLTISNLEKSLSELTNIKRSIDEFESHLASLKEKKANIELVLQDLEEERVSSSNDLKELTERLGGEEDIERTKVRELENFLSEYITLYDSIQEFESKDSVLIEQNSTNLSNARERLTKIESRRNDIQDEIKVVQNEINEAFSIERNIRDNIEFRTAEREINKIEEQILELDVKNAEHERENYQKKSREFRDKLSSLNAEHAGKIGEVKQIKDQVKQLQNDLNVEFKDIDKHYHEEWVKLQVNLLVSNDMLTYSKALDNAIMKYHSAKMEDINRILRELWNQTYKGTDIDNIEIKTDVNVQAKGNRSYNYRVVMFKNNVELDMRGRCSAGQKVLTSILIRLALAECFGSNCGMIALDEPTTNLDSDNAESLALALNNIIEFRKNQKNFQLIVITHDEKFLSHINGDKFTDHFYRVQRDEQQKSAIRSLPIHLIQDD